MTPTIEALGLEKRYRKTRALDGLDLVAEPGRVVAVLGPNGAGKTTFVRAVATLLRLDAGTLRVLAHDVRRDPGRVRGLIGLAGQFAAVEPAMTGRENLELVARRSSRRPPRSRWRSRSRSASGSTGPLSTGSPRSASSSSSAARSSGRS
jgi:ABC-2 type transport system ATP-binding protein